MTLSDQSRPRMTLNQWREVRRKNRRYWVISTLVRAFFVFCVVMIFKQYPLAGWGAALTLVTWVIMTLYQIIYKLDFHSEKWSLVQRQLQEALRSVASIWTMFGNADEDTGAYVEGLANVAVDNAHAHAQMARRAMSEVPLPPENLGFFDRYTRRIISYGGILFMAIAVIIWIPPYR